MGGGTDHVEWLLAGEVGGDGGGWEEREKGREGGRAIRRGEGWDGTGLELVVVHLGWIWGG